MNETVPISLIQEAVLEFMQDRDDAIVFGAQAVNAYVDEPRMSQDVDIMALNAEILAEDIRSLLNDRFKMAVRVRSIANGRGLRIYQIRKPKNRHFVDIRSVDTLPSVQRVERILVPTPPELIVQKIISMTSRSKTAKGMTDAADLRRLLITFSDLKVEHGAVSEILNGKNVSSEVLETWRNLVHEEIEVDDDDSY